PATPHRPGDAEPARRTAADPAAAHPDRRRHPRRRHRCGGRRPRVPRQPPTRAAVPDAAPTEQQALLPEPSATPAPAPRASNVPMTRLAPGEKPPQFVLFSFDGVGVSPNWDMFLDAADATDSRFTALMTGLYFLTDDNAFHYQGPGHAP